MTACDQRIVWLNPLEKFGIVPVSVIYKNISLTKYCPVLISQRMIFLSQDADKSLQVVVEKTRQLRYCLLFPSYSSFVSLIEQDTIRLECLVSVWRFWPFNELCTG